MTAGKVDQGFLSACEQSAWRRQRRTALEASQARPRPEAFVSRETPGVQFTAFCLAHPARKETNQ